MTCCIFQRWPVLGCRPFQKKIYASDLQSTHFKDYWGQTQDLQPVLIGYQDIPERQEQSPLYFHMKKAGHILLVSSPGLGSPPSSRLCFRCDAKANTSTGSFLPL
ncbi:hypothetical protein [Streptococcus equi]|uniref:hypothetical protein n=1 Tax=Streptococcus equi TaxID=1336 RepID=UPI001E366DCE|nr:hypothetical protein [Streptococcus equi]